MLCRKFELIPTKIGIRKPYSIYTNLSLSLLSHSAVVARELGLPTIVGVSGGLMKRLKTGMRVHIDAGKVMQINYNK